jgi:rhamnulokinase
MVAWSTHSFDNPMPSPLIPSDLRAMIAVDLGAESCRVTLLRWIEGAPVVKLMHRFSNGPVKAEDGSLRWPLKHIVESVEHGLRLCASAAPEGIRSIAVDGWAVDYVRVGEDGAPLEEPFCYRDERTIAAEHSLHSKIAPERLREITGVQLQRLNTVYQLHADRSAGLPSGRFWLNLPEFLLFHWGADPVAEYTNATHTGMVDLSTRNWSVEIVEAAGIDPASMPKLVQPGTRVGKLRGPLTALPEFSATELIAPACHDTASAIAGIPDPGSDWAYISLGTWSLVGTVVSSPLNDEQTRLEGFTNLGGVDGTICFHKSVNGMWLLKQCMDDWTAAGRVWEIAELIQEASNATKPTGMIEVDHPELMLVGSMLNRIQTQRVLRGLPKLDLSPVAAPELTSLILHSLAHRYSEVLEDVTGHARKKLRRLFVVGGGSRNKMLRELTASMTGLEVCTGAVESSTVGNFAVQLAELERGKYVSGHRATALWAACLLPAFETAI